jgi:SNF2 family DNA or RNA helicase
MVVYQIFGVLLIYRTHGDDDNLRLRMHHLALVQELKEENLATATISRKLENLRDFNHIEPVEPPVGFEGILRPYQKTGYDWLQFLKQYRFGGCLADDMGLGKTVQTLALLQYEKGSRYQSSVAAHYAHFPAL